MDTILPARWMSVVVACVAILACRCAGDGAATDGGKVFAADVGSDGYATAGAHVVLDGTRSRGDVARWSWTQTSGPSVALSGADGAKASFDAPSTDEGGVTLGFQLSIEDAAGTQSSAALRVFVTPPTGIVETTTDGKIFAALQDGRLDRDTAMQYLAFAVFDDPRLPREWRGDPTPSGSTALATIATEFPTLSPAAQDVLRPFLLPAYAEGSWDAAATAQSSGPLTVAGVNAGWASEDGPHVRVWHRSDFPWKQQSAAELRDAIEEEIWPKLAELWKDHMPMDDSGEAPFALKTGEKLDGGDGRLDVVLTDFLGKLGVASSYHALKSPAFIQIRSTLPLRGKVGLAVTAAHEITHACQYSYSLKEMPLQGSWIYEGVSTWAETFVYPEERSAQGYARDYLHTLRLPLDQPGGLRDYGAYVLFQWLVGQVADEALIPRVFARFEQEPALAALDHSFTDGTTLADHWGDFLEAAWNHGAEGWFRQYDGLEDEAWGEGGPNAEMILGSAAPDFALSVDGKVRHLAGRYRHYRFDDRHRWLTFYDGLEWSLDVKNDAEGWQTLVQEDLDDAQKRGIDVRVLVSKDGAWKPWGGWNPRVPQRHACRDTNAQRYDEVVVIFGDGIADKNHVVRPKKLDPILWTTNMGCFGWTGTATATVTSNVTTTITSSSRWERTDNSETAMVLRHHQGSWSITGEDWVEDELCAASGEGTFSEDFDPGSWQTPTITVDLFTLAGPEHRWLSGVEPSPPEMTYTLTCKRHPSEQRTGGLEPFVYELWCGDELQPIPTVGADGNASGSLDCNPNEQRQWMFQPYREP